MTSSSDMPGRLAKSTSRAMVLLRQVANVAELLAGEAAGAHLVFGEGEHGFGRDAEAAVEGALGVLPADSLLAGVLQALVDGAGGGAGELLEDDGADHGFKGCRPAVEAERADTGDDRGHDGIGFFQVVDGAAHGNFSFEFQYQVVNVQGRNRRTTEARSIEHCILKNDEPVPRRRRSECEQGRNPTAAALRLRSGQALG